MKTNSIAKEHMTFGSKMVCIAAIALLSLSPLAYSGSRSGGGSQKRSDHNYTSYTQRETASAPEHAEPYGRPTARKGFVQSPYPPYRILDLRGYKRGMPILERTTGRIFINP